MTRFLKPTDSKPIWGRSAATMAAVLIAFREVVPDASPWCYLILAGVVLVAEQVFRPSVKKEQ